MKRALVAGVFVVAAFAAAVVVLAGRGGREEQPAATTASPSRTAGLPAPPPGALVVAREAGPLAVALAAEPGRLTALVLAPSGSPRDGLRVRFLPSGAAASPCGHGCYTAPVAPGGRVVVELAAGGSVRRAAFSLPARAPAADRLVRRARVAFRALAGVSYEERLASDRTHVLETSWRLEKPDRLRYSIAHGPAAIVVGARRWDRSAPGDPWRASAQLPRLPQPATQWRRSTNAHLLSRRGDEAVVSFVDPTIPAFFTLTLNVRTLRPRLLEMTAAAHFMRDRYTSFSPAREIRPPR
ncbi:MAG TPA: hypothetical protein VFJ77_09745 [Gaiellaceae bacterium]|nr:hypothetical protein [Gaiellaceae bacterium]